jgi:ferric-dicitrate binding protein FerR (iron transport regulator)
MQQGEFRDDGVRTAVTPASLAPFSFATGVLSLDGVPIARALADLSRWYDADIRLGDTILVHERISGRFAAGSLADLATNLEWTFNLRVVRTGRVLTLYPNGRRDGYRTR